MLLKTADTFEQETSLAMDRLLAALVPVVTLVLARGWHRDHGRADPDLRSDQCDRVRHRRHGCGSHGSGIAGNHVQHTGCCPGRNEGSRFQGRSEKQIPAFAQDDGTSRAGANRERQYRIPNTDSSKHGNHYAERSARSP